MATVAQAGQRVGVDVFAQLGDVALQPVQTLEHGFFQLMRLKVPGLDGLNVLRGLGLVHIVCAIRQLAQRAGNAACAPPDDDQHDQRDGQGFVEHGAHQLVERCQRGGLGALGHDPPACDGNDGVARQHFNPLAVEHGRCAGFPFDHGVDDIVVDHSVAYALAVGVVDDVLVLVHHIDVSAVLIKVRAQQRVENIVFLEVDAAPHGTQVLAVSTKNGLRDKDDVVSRSGQIRLADHRAAFGQRLHDPCALQCLALDLQGFG